MNTFAGVGRMTADPQLNYTGNGTAVCNFRIAINRPFKNQQGEYDADFLNCVVWRQAAEAVANYTKKGSLVSVNGSVQSRSYENNDGQRVNVVEVRADNVNFLEKPDRSKNGEESKSVNNDDPFDGNSVDDNQELPF